MDEFLCFMNFFSVLFVCYASMYSCQYKFLLCRDVCMYVMFVYIYIYIYVCKYLCLYVCVFIFMNLCENVRGSSLRLAQNWHAMPICLLVIASKVLSNVLVFIMQKTQEAVYRSSWIFVRSEVRRMASSTSLWACRSARSTTYS
jgi:hypothetical protein